MISQAGDCGLAYLIVGLGCALTETCMILAEQEPDIAPRYGDARMVNPPGTSFPCSTIVLWPIMLTVALLTWAVMRIYRLRER